MARPEKVAAVEAIAGQLTGAESVVLADFTGLSVEKMTVFRAGCRKEGILCRVIKNRLAKIAADQVDLSVLHEHFQGPTALISSTESQVDPAKVVVDFAKENKALVVKGGIVDGQFLSPEEIVALSKVPSRDELIAKMMGSINSPASGIVGTINGVMASLARVISAAKEEQAA